MKEQLRSNFTLTFQEQIWNMVAVPESSMLIIEHRDDLKRVTKFSAWNFVDNVFLWRDKVLDEPWWVNVLVATSSAVLFQVYTDVESPNRKSLVCAELDTLRIRWKVDEFSFHRIAGEDVIGYEVAEDPAEVRRSLSTGKIVDHRKNGDEETTLDKISLPLRPFQYMEGSKHFDTVKAFLLSSKGHTIISGAEYLEYDGMIFISYYLAQPSGLANYLLVLNEYGSEILHENLDDRLQGLGVDTFFILAGNLFFVRRKRELLSYRIL